MGLSPGRCVGLTILRQDTANAAPCSTSWASTRYIKFARWCRRLSQPSILATITAPHSNLPGSVWHLVNVARPCNHAHTFAQPAHAPAATHTGPSLLTLGIQYMSARGRDRSHAASSTQDVRPGCELSCLFLEKTRCLCSSRHGQTSQSTSRAVRVQKRMLPAVNHRLPYQNSTLFCSEAPERASLFVQQNMLQTTSDDRQANALETIADSPSRLLQVNPAN